MVFVPGIFKNKLTPLKKPTAASTPVVTKETVYYADYLCSFLLNCYFDNRNVVKAVLTKRMFDQLLCVHLM